MLAWHELLVKLYSQIPVSIVGGGVPARLWAAACFANLAEKARVMCGIFAHTPPLASAEACITRHHKRFSIADVWTWSASRAEYARKQRACTSLARLPAHHGGQRHARAIRNRPAECQDGVLMMGGSAVRTRRYLRERCHWCQYGAYQTCCPR